MLEAISLLYAAKTIFAGEQPFTGATVFETKRRSPKRQMSQKGSVMIDRTQMESPTQSLGPDADALLAQHGGPITLPGPRGDFVIMRTEVYEAMLGLAADDEAETLASIRRGIADLDAGRVQDLDEAFDELDRRYGV